MNRPRLPFWTLGICGAALVVFAAPQLAASLVYQREAIANGEPWRLVTGHLVHFSGEHLLKDLLGLLVAGTLLEQRDHRLFALLCIGSAALIGVALYAAEPHMLAYGGLSGVVVAAFTCLTLQGASEPGPYGRLCRVVLVGLAAKIAFELALGPRPSSGFTLVPLSHAVGGLAGVAFHFFARPSRSLVVA
jgi:rhomboid family GlyGly-CTERM serine protease